MELKVTKERVLEAAEGCPDVKRALKTLFPEAFEDAEPKRLKPGDVTYVQGNCTVLVYLDPEKLKHYIAQAAARPGYLPTVHIKIADNMPDMPLVDYNALSTNPSEHERAVKRLSVEGVL